MTKPGLVLDLDGTLIGTSRHGNTGKHHFVVDFDPKEEPVYVTKRPGLDLFLKAMSSSYQLIVYSMGQKSYVHMVVARLDPERSLFSRSLCRDSCKSSMPGSHIKDYKDLEEVGEPLDKTIWLDDFRDSYRNNLGNGLVVPMFRPTTRDDRVLLDLVPCLQDIATKPDLPAALRELELPVLTASNFASTVSRCGLLFIFFIFSCVQESLVCAGVGTLVQVN